MVVPKRHTNTLEELESRETQELFLHMKKIMAALRKTFKPDGFNIGLNLGRIAGAGIDKHLHFHIVPRWQGDTNFMPILSNTKIIPQSLKQAYKKIKEALGDQIRTFPGQLRH